MKTRYAPHAEGDGSLWFNYCGQSFHWTAATGQHLYVKVPGRLRLLAERVLDESAARELANAFCAAPWPPEEVHRPDGMSRPLAEIQTERDEMLAEIRRELGLR